MNWEKIVRSGSAPSTVKASLKVSSKGCATLIVTVPTSMAGAWDGHDKFNAYWGKDCLTNMIRIEPDKDGEFKATRFKAALVFRLPDAPHFPDDSQKKTSCAAVMQDLSLDITLPVWAQQAQPAPEIKSIEECEEVYSGGDAYSDKLSLMDVRLDYLTVVTNKGKTKLTPGQAKVFRTLLEARAPVPTKEIHPDKNTAGVTMSGLRRALAHVKLEVENEHGVGFTLKRAA